MDAILEKFKDTFIEEAQGLLDTLEKTLLSVETKPNDKELTSSAFRAMHTLKGISGMYGFETISELTHHLESIWQNVRDSLIEFNREIFDITFNSIDHIRKLLSDPKLENADNKNNQQCLLENVMRISKTTPLKEIQSVDKERKSNSPTSTWHILLRITEALFFRGISLKNIISDLVALGEYEIYKVESLCDSETDVWSILLTTDATGDAIKETFLFIEDDCTLVNLTKDNIFSNKVQDEIMHTKQENRKTILDMIDELNNGKEEPLQLISDENRKFIETANKIKQSVKRISVDATKLDQLMFLVSELITVNSQLNISARIGNFSLMVPHLEKVDTLSKQFRNNALEIRLVPINDITLRFQRLIRDLSKNLEKQVEFETHGVDTEVDKNTLDVISEPLMHLIRNCLDHGIEKPAERIKRGKPETGTIKLNSYYSGNYIFIEIEDDGNGIDPELIRRKALEKGFITSDITLSKDAINELIFLPGFSTAQNLTEVSGRGIGMDIVKKRITDIRGNINIESELGKGTKFTIKLHQSIAILDTMLIKTDKFYNLVPIEEIEQCMQVRYSEIQKRETTNTIEIMGELVPFLCLREKFNLNTDYPEKVRLLVVNKNYNRFAIVADEIIGEHQAVLKSLGKAFESQNYFSAGSLMGDGNTAFLLDADKLYTSIDSKVITEEYL